MDTENYFQFDMTVNYATFSQFNGMMEWLSSGMREYPDTGHGRIS